MTLRLADLSTALRGATRAPTALFERGLGLATAQSQRFPAIHAPRLRPRMAAPATASARNRISAASAPVPAASPSLARELKFTRTDSADECRLAIEGALDVHSAPELRAVFDSVVAAQPLLVTLDLEGLTMIDSSGVGAIVSLFKRVKAAGGKVVVKGVQNQPLAVCKLLKLDRVFGL